MSNYSRWDAGGGGLVEDKDFFGIRSVLGRKKTLVSGHSGMSCLVSIRLDTL